MKKVVRVGGSWKTELLLLQCKTGGEKEKMPL
jgi:hypothetical protein